MEVENKLFPSATAAVRHTRTSFLRCSWMKKAHLVLKVNDHHFHFQPVSWYYAFFFPLVISWEGKRKVYQGWMIWNLVTSVQRRLQAERAFGIISRSTSESRSTVVRSATSHSIEKIALGPTPSFTLGRNRTSAHSATSHANILLTSERISRSTLGGKLFNCN